MKDDMYIVLSSVGKCLTCHMLGSQLGNFLILILFKQLLCDKIFLGQEKN
jgi:hypothetical protein